MSAAPTTTDVLWQHQKEGIAWLKERSRGLLADEPGLGKSAQLLLAAEEPVLVVAPAMVLDSGVWDDETARWAPGMDVTQVPYSGLSSREKTENGGTRATGRARVEYRKRHWGTIIADEAHYLKGRKTAWSVAFAKLHAERIFMATGTPLPNWAEEAYVLARILHPGDPHFAFYWPWASFWFNMAPTKYTPMAVGGLREDRTWAEFHAACFGGVMLRRLRDDVLDLPPLTIQPWRVKMGREQARVYSALKRDYMATLESGERLTAWSSSGQLVKLTKAATGLEAISPGAGASAKLDALEAILRDRKRPTLVVGHYRDTVAACARVASRIDGVDVRTIDGTTSAVERRSAVRAFQSGSLPVLCATIGVISEGVTLVAADQIIRVERSWRPSSNEQVIRRLHRIGQERPVLVVDLVTEGTVDYRVLRLLAEKTDQQMMALTPGDLRAIV